MRANVGSNAIHLDICDGTFRRLVLIGYLFDIHPSKSKELLDPPPGVVVNGIAMLELADEGCHILPCPAQHEVYVVGHQDKRQHDDFRAARRLDGHEVHPHLEVFFVTEPEFCLQVIRRYKPNLFHSS